MKEKARGSETRVQVQQRASAMAARIDPSGSRGSPSRAFELLQRGQLERGQYAYVAGHAAGLGTGMDRGSVRGSPSQVLHLLESSAVLRNMVCEYAGMEHPEPEEQVYFDPDSFLCSSLPFSQEPPGAEDLQNAIDPQNAMDPQNAIDLEKAYQTLAAEHEKSELLENQPDTHNVNAEIQGLAMLAEVSSNSAMLAELPCLQKSKKRKFKSPEHQKPGAAEAAEYQRERQNIYNQEAREIEEEIRQAHTRLIQCGKLTLEQVEKILCNTQERTMTSDVGAKLFQEIQSLRNTKGKTATERSQLHRLQKKLRSLIAHEQKTVLDACLVLFIPEYEPSNEFCAPT